MKILKFRQFIDGQFHYWGYLNHGFESPLASANAHNLASDQFTGRQLDSKDLYAGDILKITLEWNDEVYYVEVKHSNEGTCFEVDVSYAGMDYDITALGWALDQWENENSIVELVGNEHENPELLELVE